MRSYRPRWRHAIALLAISVVVSAAFPCGRRLFAAERGASGPVSKSARFFLRGNEFFDKSNYQEAVAAYTEAIRLDPYNVVLYEARAITYRKLGKDSLARNDEAAVRDMERARRVPGAMPVAYQAPQGQTPPATAPARPGAPTPPRPTPPMPTPPMPTPPMPTPPMPTPPMPTPPAPSTTAPAPDAPLSPSQAPSPETGFSLSSLLAERITAATQSNVGAPSNVIAPTGGQGAQTTGELLTQAASVNVRRTSALNLDPRVRGLNSSQLNASASGVTLYKTRVDIDSLFSNIDPGIVRDLTVLDGPYSSLYGPGFAFLVADLFPTPRYDCPEWHSSTNMDYGTNGQNFYARESVWGGGKDWGVYATYGIRTGNDYSPGDNDFNDFRVPASYKQWDTYLAVGMDLTSRWRGEMSYIRVEKNDLELPGVIYDIDQSKDEQFNFRFVMQEDKSGPEQAIVQYWYSRTPYRGNSLRESKHITFYDRYITDVFNGFEGGLAPFNIANTFAEGSLQTNGFRSLLTWGEKDSMRLTAGVDWRRYEQFYQETHVDFTGTFGTLPFGTQPFGIPDSSLDDTGVFTNLVIPANEMVTFTVGSRLDYTQAFVNNDPINAGGTGAGDDKPTEWLGMLYGTARINLTDETSLDAGMAYAMRNPNLGELYSDSPFVPLVRQGNAISVGDSDLDPERNLQFDLGLTNKREWLTTDWRMFYSNIENYILYDFTGNAGAPDQGVFSSRQYTYTNLERASLYGTSAQGEARVRDGMSLIGSIAYVKGTNHSPGQLSGIEKGAEGLPGIYPLNSMVGVRFYEPEDDRWGMEFLSRMVMGQEYVADSLFELPTPGFTVFDIRGYMRWNKRVQFSAAILNLLDRTYTEHGSLVLVDKNGNQTFVKNPGISLRIGAEVKLGPDPRPERPQSNPLPPEATTTQPGQPVTQPVPTIPPLTPPAGSATPMPQGR